METKEANDIQEDDLYFDDMDDDQGFELDLDSCDGLGRIPKTRFTNMSLW